MLQREGERVKRREIDRERRIEIGNHIRGAIDDENDYRSDVLGQFMPLVGRDWTQSGLAQLFYSIKRKSGLTTNSNNTYLFGMKKRQLRALDHSGVKFDELR
ncbi:hypothetical protein M8C21_030835, partial [Ambrosia artemisiifolia]